MIRYYILDGNRIVEIRYYFPSRPHLHYYIEAMDPLRISRYVSREEFMNVPPELTWIQA